MTKATRGPLPKKISKKKPKSRQPLNIVLPSADSDTGGQSSTRPVQLLPLKCAPTVDTRKGRKRTARSTDQPEGDNTACDFFFEGGGARVSRPVFRERTQDDLWAEARPKIHQQYLQHAPGSEARTIRRLQQWRADTVQRTCDACVPGSQHVKVICVEAAFCVSVPFFTCGCALQPATWLASCRADALCCSVPVLV
jgi:hypothetical protein